MAIALDAPAPTRVLPARAGLIAAAAALVASVSLLVGARYGLLLAVGLGIGATLEGLRFGFAGPWRAMILRREPAGLLAQLVAIGAVAVVAIPLVAGHPGELVGAHAPVGWAMVGGAFVFGAAMQVVLGCGSGTLINAGSGNAVGAVALPFFAVGSFLGAWHLAWWTSLGAAPVVTFAGLFGPVGGAVATVAALTAVAVAVLALANPGARRIPGRLWLAAGLVAALALVNLIAAGQPWGVVYGLGLWVAKGAAAAGVDLSDSTFWSAPGNLARIEESVLTDVTSLTNFGLIGGAFLVTAWRRGLGQGAARLPLRAWIAAMAAGLAMGYSSRLAFGCNVGAFFSGISTGSLHGWAWFAAAFAGSAIGVRLRPRLGLEPRT